MRALILAMLVACDAGKPPPPPAAPVVHNVAPPVAPDAAPVDERAAVIAAALARYDQDPTTMLDGGLIVEPAPGLSVPSIAAPHTAKTLAELEREADKAGKAVGFIHVFSVEVAGTSATITYGGDVALEKARRGHKLCCCESTDTYVKKAGVWTFASRGMSMCS
jgi:hypothetical protein